MSQSTFVPSPLFHDAAKFVSTAPELKNVSNNVKLELYGLFKMITVASNPNTSRPSIFDMTGRAKWDAWARLSKELENEPMEAVQQKYLDQCSKLGWIWKGEASNSEPPITSSMTDESDAPIDWDAPYEPTNDAHRHNGTLMGNAVSVLETPSEDIDTTTLHGLCIVGDVGKLRTLLDLNPDININEIDEFGYTGLHLAADRGNVSVVKLLIDRGANLSVLDSDGYTAIELADASEKSEVVDFLRSL